MKKNKNIIILLIIISSCKINKEVSTVNNIKKTYADCLICFENKAITDSSYCIKDDLYEGIILYSSEQLSILKRANVTNILNTLWIPTINEIKNVEEKKD